MFIKYKYCFKGTPPFQFTYTRRELLIVGGKRKQGRVLETKTITNINEHKHSIYASQEGFYNYNYNYFHLLYK